jgi:hypothetical protein
MVDTDPVAPSTVVFKEFAPPAVSSGKGNDSVGVEIINQPAAAVEPAAPPLGASPFGRPAPATAPANDANELKPNAPADPNELKPTDSSPDQALPPPPQVNELQQGQGSSSSATAGSDGSAPASDSDLSSSKKKKKTGLKKLIPF